MRDAAVAGVAAVYRSGGDGRSGGRGAGAAAHQDVQGAAGAGVGGVRRSCGALGDDTASARTTGASTATTSLRRSELAECRERSLCGPIRDRNSSRSALTSEKEEHWKKWIGLYNEKMLSKGEFRDLYVYGYDVPEAYAIEKDGKMYYAFFAEKENARSPVKWNCAG